MAYTFFVNPTPMQRSSILLALPLILAACGTAAGPSSMPISPAPTMSAAPSSPAPTGSTRTVTLLKGAMVRVPASWDVQPMSPDGFVGSDGGWYANLTSMAGHGSMNIYDLSQPLPRIDEGVSPGSPPEKNFLALLDDIGKAGVLTPTLARRLVTDDTGAFVSVHGDVLAPQPVPAAQSGAVAWSYTTARGQDAGIFPVYHALLLDPEKQLLVEIFWDVPAEKEPLLVQKNKEVGAVLSPSVPQQDFARVHDAAHAWFKDYLESTPRTKLSWGEQLQQVDEVLSSYVRA
jgi:hypothetical protein